MTGSVGLQQRLLRRLDRLGRAWVPRDAHRVPGYPGQVGFALAAGGGAPPPAEPRLACVFCGARDHVIPHRGKGICVDCVREIREIVSAP